MGNPGLLFLACLILAGNSDGLEKSATGNSELVLVASTPGDEQIKSILGISPSKKVDFIRWYLTLSSSEASNFTLNIIFGEAQQNTLGFKGGGDRKIISGTFNILQNDPHVNAPTFHLKSTLLSQEIAFVQLNENIFHLLTPNHELMVGNGGWSYTLNKSEALEISGDLPHLFTQENLKNDTTTEMTFIGRTPCEPLATDKSLLASEDCFKLKWKLVLHKDKKNLQPDAYSLDWIYRERQTITGKWKVINGTAENADAVVYQIFIDEHQKEISFLVGDKNVLFFLDEKKRLYAGNSDFSFTLNREL